MGALVWAIHALWVAIEPPERPPQVETAVRAKAGGVAAEDQGEADELRPERAWPALFGESAPEPQDLEAPAPSATVNFALKGLVTSGEMRWAIVTADGVDALVREGDTLAGGAEVEEIRPEGVWLRIDERRELVAFSDEAPVRTTSVEMEPGASSEEAAPEEIQTQSLTPVQLRDIILKAEADRVARGVAATGPRQDR
jgi:type II secretory pathway component PulC